MRRKLAGAASLLRYALLGFMTLAFLQSQWQPMFWFFAAAWVVFISQIKFNLQSNDPELRALLTAAQLSLSPTLLAIHFGSQHNWLLCGYLLSGFALAAIMYFAMDSIEARSTRAATIARGAWLLSMQGGATVILAWLAFLH